MAQVRLGKTEAARALLTETLSSQFLLGDIKEDALLQAAGAGAEYKVLTQRCEAKYFVGIVHLVAGEHEKAANCFRECLAVGAMGWAEDVLARAELMRPVVVR